MLVGRIVSVAMTKHLRTEDEIEVLTVLEEKYMVWLARKIFPGEGTCHVTRIWN